MFRSSATAREVQPDLPPTKKPGTQRTAGGSSAGSGAAVASGIGPMAIGSDGGGSIRIPGSINGLFGLKGSMGRVPLYPGTKDETAAISGRFRH
jgi:aspartyl-tRNA(Asn)/glutamyl-tRNA(Gln) amidotransferase subunit A